MRFLRVGDTAQIRPGGGAIAEEVGLADLIESGIPGVVHGGVFDPQRGEVHQRYGYPPLFDVLSGDDAV